MKDLEEEQRRLMRELSELAKRRAAGTPVPEFQSTIARFEALRAEFAAGIDVLQRQLGLSDADLEAVEASKRVPRDTRTWWKDMVTTPVTTKTTDHEEAAISALEKLVDPRWLRAEDPHVLRLDPRRGLELVGSTPIDRRSRRPQRFAQMLVVARDHLKKRPELDIFSAAAAVPELVALGTRLNAIPALGVEAEAKLAHLAEMAPGDVASTLFELFVGTSLILAGRSAKMLKPSGAKTPDFRVDDLVIPMVVECKRRVDLFEYERKEADAVHALYAPFRARLARDTVAVRIDVEFLVEVGKVGPADFEVGVEQAIRTGSAEVGWGSVRAVELPKAFGLPTTRLYSPDMLSRVFSWDFDAGEWDGLIADVDATDCRIDHVARPRGLRWRSRSETARLKKSRGITSLFGDAAKQVPAGDAGVLYIGYNEASATHADARTQHTLTTIENKEWHHEPGRVIPLVFVSRFVAAPRGVGTPDLIESTQVLYEENYEGLIEDFPCPVVTRSVPAGT